MEYLSVQLILAARRGDDGGWMELLIFVVIAVIYALGGILKKTKDMKIKLEDEGEPERPARKTKQRRRPKARPERPKAAERGPVKFIFERPKRGVKPLVAPEVTPLAPALEVDIKEPKQLISKSIEELEREQAITALKKEKSEVVIEQLFDFEKSDELKRAILHYEILGKPLSLRGPLQ